jgi:agmatinase
MNKLETVAIVGVSVDENSSFMRGTAAAPRHIREALHSGSTNLCAENGVDLKTDPRWWDAGDVGSAEEQPSFTQIEEHLDGLLGQGTAVIALGGDHSITYPLVRAHARTHTGLNLLHLDAHPDLYDELDGSRISHACPFARILEEELVARLVSIGIRTANPHQRQQAERFGVETYGVTDDWSAALASLRPPLYLSLDLDVLDPAFAPGVSHYEPGGLSTRDVLEILHDLPCPPIGADIVELNPDRDLHGVTAMVAAKLLKEIIALMLVSPNSSTLPVWS